MQNTMRFAHIAAFAFTLLLAAAGSASAQTYCRDIGYHACPTGATQFCDVDPIRPDDASQAKLACETCFGVTCESIQLDGIDPHCGDYFTPTLSHSCSSRLFTYGEDSRGYPCPGRAGEVWATNCASHVPGTWSDPPLCFNGVYDVTYEARADCGGACTQNTPCCDNNGVKEVGEDCDDGNTVDGDGCSACFVDFCWLCSGSPSACVPHVGKACADDGSICTSDTCNASGVCAHPPANEGAACGEDGSVCTEDQCVSGTCTQLPVNNGTACGEDGSICTEDECVSGTCTQLPVNDGAACPSDGNECTNDQCSNGSCTHPANTGAGCTDDGNPCTLDQCDAGGGCSHPAATGAACTDDGNPCTLDQCDELGACAHTAATGTACADDGNPCTLDQCDASGDCAHPANTGASCADDGNDCTLDECDASGACVHSNAADGSACDDESLCTDEDVCISGVCAGEDSVTCCDGGFCHADTGACSMCPDGFEVSNGGFSCARTYEIGYDDIIGIDVVCSESEVIGQGSIGFSWTDLGGALPEAWSMDVAFHSSRYNDDPSFPEITPRLNGAGFGGYFLAQYGSCGGASTLREFNNGGTNFYVKGGTNTVTLTRSNSFFSHGLAADENGVFATVTVRYAPPLLTPEPTGTPCNDGSACTLVDECDSGSCVGSSAVVCSASDNCHVPGTCDPETGVCDNPPAFNGLPCNDGNECTMYDECQSGVCSGSAVTCPDGGDCYGEGTCIPATGTCSYPAVSDGSPCDDGNACTTGETCQSGVCTAASTVTCGPAPSACHFSGVCNPSTGSCEYPTLPESSPCDDGNACTLFESCMSGNCVAFFFPSGSYCEDGNACTVNDSCSGGVCVGGESITCKASDACHVAGSCHPVTGCSETPINCDDGSACTEDSCDPMTGCVSEALVEDSCRDAAGKFSYGDSDDDAKDKMKWKWGGGPATSQAELGDPTADADYRLCVFASIAGVPTVFLEATVPASNAAWSAAGDSGYKYTDKLAIADGIAKMTLKGSDLDKTKLSLGGKGAALGDALLPLGSSLTGMQVQLKNLSSGVCWESSYPASSIKHDDAKVSAATPK